MSAIYADVTVQNFGRSSAAALSLGVSEVLLERKELAERKQDLEALLRLSEEIEQQAERAKGSTFEQSRFLSEQEVASLESTRAQSTTAQAAKQFGLTAQALERLRRKEAQKRAQAQAAEELGLSQAVLQAERKRQEAVADSLRSSKPTSAPLPN